MPPAPTPGTSIAAVKVRKNLLTDSNTREQVGLVGEEMDGIAREQH